MVKKHTYVEKALYVEEYLKTLSMSKAAEKIGYKKNSRAAAGRALFGDREVRRMLEDHLFTTQLSRMATIKKTEEELMKVAFVDPKDLFNDNGSVKPMSEIPEDLRRAVKSYDVSEDTLYSQDGETVRRKTKITLQDKIKAMAEILKINQAYSEAALTINGNASNVKKIEVEFV